MSIFDRIRAAAAAAAAATPETTNANAAEQTDATVVLVGTAGAVVTLSRDQYQGKTLSQLLSTWGAALGLAGSDVAWKFAGNTVGAGSVVTDNGIYKAIVTQEEKGAI